MKHLGPYQIHKEIARGGMGVIYLASSPEHPRVALKTLELASASMLESLRREVHALARLRHPGIVQIVDHGQTDAGLPWYAMEWIEHGVPLSGCALSPTETEAGSYLHLLTVGLGDVTLDLEDSAALAPSAQVAHLEAPRSKEAMSQGLEQLHALCYTLAYLHGAGLVHCDLKPGNIVVRPDGRPVLIDFGLAASSGGQHGRESLQLDALRAGTPLYMAPEQILGEPLDARADLYALGCILYDVICGSPPFPQTAGTPTLLSLHLNEAPRLPSAFTPDLPPQLDTLVLRLLEKKPADRTGHALDVARELADVLVELGAARPEPPWPDKGPGRPVLYRSGFQSQPVTEVLERLDTACAALREKRGGMILLRGASGVGKTRVLMELSRRVRRQGWECSTLGCEPSLEMLSLWRRVFERLSVHDPTQNAVEASRSAGLKASAARAGLYRALHRRLAERARASHARGLVLFLDDLHHTDALSLDFLAWLERTERLEADPLLLVASTRADTGELLAVARNTCELPPHSPENLRAMVRGMLAARDDRVVEPIADALVPWAQGSPVALSEVLQEAVRCGVLSRTSQGGWRWDEARIDRLPTSLELLCQERIAQVGVEARRLLDVMAVGTLSSLREGVLEEAARRDGFEDILNPRAELIEARLLEASEPGTLRFVLDTRELVYPAMPEARRHHLHTVFAELFEAHLDEHRGGAEIAEHWAAAGRQSQAQEAFLRAAEHAERHYALHEAETLYTTYLELFDGPTPESIRGRMELARSVLRPLGENDRALALLERSLAELEACEAARADAALASTLLGQLGVQHRLAGQWDDALVVLRAAVERSPEHTTQRASTLNSLGNLLLSLDELDEAKQCFAASAEVYHALGHRSEGIALSNLGNACRALGQLNEALESQRAAIAIHQAHGNRYGECVVYGSIAASYYELNDTMRTLESYTRSGELAREIGDLRLAAMVTGYRGSLLHRMGELERSQELLHSALDDLRECGAQRLIGLMLLYLAMCQMDAGALEKANDLLDEAESLMRRLQQTAHLVDILLVRAQIASTRGQCEAAVKHTREALELARSQRLEAAVQRPRAALARALLDADHTQEALTELEAVEVDSIADGYGRALVMLDLGRVLSSTGEHDRGRAYLEQAHALLEAGHPRGARCFDALCALAEWVGEPYRERALQSAPPPPGSPAYSALQRLNTSPSGDGKHPP